MIRFLLAAPAILALVLGGCTRHNPVENANVDIERAASKAQGDVAAYRATAAADRARVKASKSGFEAPATPDGQSAAQVAQSYFTLIGGRQYAQARALWTPGAIGAGVSDAGFAAPFARYGAFHGQVGAPGPIDAAAGQRYVTIPVQIAAQLKDGTPVRQIGTVTLHRTADIDGATPEQRAWHLQTLVIDPAPAAP